VVEVGALVAVEMVEMEAPVAVVAAMALFLQQPAELETHRPNLLLKEIMALGQVQEPMVGVAAVAVLEVQEVHRAQALAVMEVLELRHQLLAQA
jgi:hypothetical protein